MLPDAAGLWYGFPRCGTMAARRTVGDWPANLARKRGYGSDAGRKPNGIPMSAIPIVVLLLAVGFAAGLSLGDGLPRQRVPGDIVC